MFSRNSFKLYVLRLMILSCVANLLSVADIYIQYTPIFRKELEPRNPASLSSLELAISPLKLGSYCMHLPRRLRVFSPLKLGVRRSSSKLDPSPLKLGASKKKCFGEKSLSSRRSSSVADRSSSNGAAQARLAPLKLAPLKLGCPKFILLHFFQKLCVLFC